MRSEATVPCPPPATRSSATRSSVSRSSTTPSSTHPDGLAARLRSEWHHQRRDPDAIRRARSWQIVEGDLDDLDDLLRLAGFQRPDQPHADQVLRRLVDLAADDELATRVVLERILPGLLARARVAMTRGAGPDAFDELVGAAWITIRTFDPQRRPACLAAALIRGAEDRSVRAGERRALTHVHISPHRLAWWPTEHRDDSPALVELAGVVRDARASGHTDADDEGLLRGLLGCDTIDALAAAEGVTPRTIRNRRDRLTYRLRRAAAAA